MSLGRRYQIALLVLICLAIYYPVVFNTTLAIDDVDMVQRMENGVFSWQGLFSPRSSFYYRPLLILTFWFDLWVWNFQQTFSLVENVLLHAANSVLIFLIAERYLNVNNRNTSLTFCGALIFAVHPLATESINWMSGRTDLLATFFVLLCVLVLHRALRTGSYFFLTLSIVCYFAGIMSKEVVVFFLPAALYLIYFWGRESGEKGFSSRWKPAFLFAAPIGAGIVGYIAYRALKTGGSGRSLEYLLERMPYEGLDLLRVVFKVFGFYVKKLFFPFPLNFAIIDVSDAYTYLGIVVFIFVLWLLSKNSRCWAFAIIAFSLLTPAIAIALTHIAWTPLAERYVYLPAAFLALGLVAAIQPVLEQRRVFVTAVSLLLLWSLPAAAATLQRSFLWQDKEALYADTLKKSPSFNRLRNDYGLSLLRNSRSDLALEQFRRGQGTNGTYYSLINEARLLLIEDKPDAAKELLLANYSSKEQIETRGLKLLTHIEVKQLAAADNPDLKEKIYAELYETHELIYQKTRDPFYLYRSGQLALKLGDKIKAQQFFADAYRRAPHQAHYKTAAGKLSEKLKKEL